MRFYFPNVVVVIVAVGDTLMDCLIELRAREFWSVSRGRKQRSRGELIGMMNGWDFLGKGFQLRNDSEIKESVHVGWSNARLTLDVSSAVV